MVLRGDGCATGKCHPSYYIIFLVALLIGSCVGQWLIDPEPYGGHSFPNLKISTLQITLLLSAELRCHQEEKVNRLSRCSMQVDLTINTSNTQGICINAIPDASITADVKRVGLVEEFGDLGSPVARDNAAPVEVHLLDSSLYGS